MSGTNGTSGSGGSNASDDDQSSPSVEEIEATIAQTRHDLAETVDALSAKADVKARARQRVEDTKYRASEAVAQGKDALSDENGDLKPVLPVAAGIAALVVVVGVVLVVRRRR